MSVRSVLCLVGVLYWSATVVSAPVSGSSVYTESQMLADPNWGPVPGEDPIFNTYWGKAPTWPGNLTDAVLPTQKGAPGVDDRVWQNLLAAEWVIFNFYQQAVERFNESSFVALGMPTNTYQRIMEMRNNEAGHLRIFQKQSSPTSVKPGACQYAFPFDDAISFLALVTVLEISSMAFLTGLVQQVQLNTAKGAMIAIAETETRHEVWSLVEIWKTNPFGGPSDTVFPYATEVLEGTAEFVVPGSCPKENPHFPTPYRGLPALSAAKGTKSLAPGTTIDIAFPNPNHQPEFRKDQQYYAVFFHGLQNETVPIDTQRWPGEAIRVTIPNVFEEKGVIAAVIADTPGAPSKESLMTGPGIILQQPVGLGVKLL